MGLVCLYWQKLWCKGPPRPTNASEELGCDDDSVLANIFLQLAKKISVFICHNRRPVWKHKGHFLFDDFFMILHVIMNLLLLGTTQPLKTVVNSSVALEELCQV